MLLTLGNVVIVVSASNEHQPEWPTSWILADIDPNEAGSTKDYRDIHMAFYNYDTEYLYLRLECFGAPNFAFDSESRYKWFIDADDPHNMAWQGGNVYDAEFLLFVEDSPKPGGDGSGEVYFLPDVDGDGLIGDDWPNYLQNPGPILNPLIAGYRVINNSIDVYIRQADLGNPVSPYFTYSADQEDPNLDSTATGDRSDSYWDEDLSQADVGITIAASAEMVYAEDLLTYTLHVTNHGPNNAVTVNVTDILPDEITFIDAVPLQDDLIDRTIFWNFTSLAIDDSIFITITVAINNDTNLGVITNYAAVSSDTHDPMPGNNVVVKNTTVSVDNDGDGIPDCNDSDDDNDGYSDENETACGSDPLDNESIPSDFDGDFIPDCVDPDDDNDGVPDDEDAYPYDPTQTEDTIHDGGDTITGGNNDESDSSTSPDNTPATDDTNNLTGDNSTGDSSLGFGAEDNDTLNSSYNPISAPSITGPSEGYTDVLYNFSVHSNTSDVDVMFIIDWGDGISNGSDFLVAGSVWMIPHKWSQPGQYLISVTAFNNQSNATTSQTINIDTPTVPGGYNADPGNVLFVLLSLLSLMFLFLYFLLGKRKKDQKKEVKK